LNWNNKMFYRKRTGVRSTLLSFWRATRVVAIYTCQTIKCPPCEDLFVSLLSFWRPDFFCDLHPTINRRQGKARQGMAGCFQTPEWYVDGQPARYHAGKGGGFVVLPGIGHVAGHALWINVVRTPCFLCYVGWWGG
jgi:hypothetical protein